MVPDETTLRALVNDFIVRIGCNPKYEVLRVTRKDLRQLAREVAALQIAADIRQATAKQSERV